MSSKTIDVDDYGDMLAQVKQLELIYYREEGHYQGEYVAILADDKRMFIYKDNFGSCSGCDWLEDESNYNSASQKRYTISYKAALDYCQEKPLYILPYKDTKFWLKEVLKLIEVELDDE